MPRLSEPRIHPVDPAGVDDETRGQLERASTALGRPLNIFATLANHPKLMKRWLVFGNHVLGKNTLPEREREILILRTGWLCRSEYEWAQHVVIGKRCGLSDAEIEDIARGPDAEGWSAADRTLLVATDELCGDAFISDTTWKQLAETWNEQQLMDLIFTVGQYNLVSMALNSLGVQLDEGIGLKGFPKL